MSDCCLTPAADPVFRGSGPALHRKCGDVTRFSASLPSPPASSSSSSSPSCSLRGSLKRPKAINLQRFRFSFLKDEFSDCQMSDNPSHSLQQQQPKLWRCSQSTSDKTFDRSSASCRQPSMWSSASLPCLPASSTSGHLTNILPFLFLGSQHDALSEDVIKSNGITHILNVSLTSPQCPFVPEVNFLRIPVNDSYTDRILPHFQRAFQFLDDVRALNGRALVHCLAGISRSPTLVIAYVMRSMEMTSEEAYSFVKGKRSRISPNFNFLGQLLEFEALCQRKSFSSGSAEGTATKPDTVTAEATGPGSPSSASNGLHSDAAPRSAFNEDEDHRRRLMKFPLDWESQFAEVPTVSIDQLPFTPCFALLPDKDPGRERGSVGPQPHETKAKPGRSRRFPPAPRGANRPPPPTISAVQFGLSSIKSSIFKRTDHHNKPVLLMD